MTKLLARIAIVGAASTLENDWHKLIDLRGRMDDLNATHPDDESDPRRAYVIQETRKAIEELEAFFNARIAADSNLIQGLVVAMPYLEDERTQD